MGTFQNHDTSNKLIHNASYQVFMTVSLLPHALIWRSYSEQ